MGDIPSKDEFAELALQCRQKAEQLLCEAKERGHHRDVMGVPISEKCHEAAQVQTRLALACTIAGNVVDRETMVNAVESNLTIDGLDHDAIREALTKGGGDG